MVVLASSDSGLASHLISSLLRWATEAWSHSARARGRLWTTSMPLLLQMAVPATVSRVYGYTTAQISTQPTCVIQMEIRSPLCVVASRRRSDRQEHMMTMQSIDWKNE